MLTLLFLASQVALVSPAQAAAPAWALVPGGAGVYAHGHPGRGTVYAVTQAAGIGLVGWGEATRISAQESGDDAAFTRGSLVTAVGVTLAAASYLAGAIDASRLHDTEEVGDGGAPPPRNAPPPAAAAPVAAPTPSELPGGAPPVAEPRP